MEIVKTGIQLAQAVRLVVAAVKGEPKLIIAARQLMRSCELYEDCLKTLKNNLEERVNFNANGSVASSSGKKSAPDSGKNDLDRSLDLVYKQIESDAELLKEILNVTEGIAKTHKKYNIFFNSMLSLSSGRVDTIKELESELIKRVQMITTLMMRDVYKAASGVDASLVDAIGDVDASLFWTGHFGAEKKVSFRLFVEAYQAYLMHTFFFRRVERSDVVTLLRHTLLDISLSSYGASSEDVILMGTEVSVTAFISWLRRYGPMKDTLTKLSAVTLPVLGLPVPWLVKHLSRDAAVRHILKHVEKKEANPEKLLVVRHSSDPAYHFVISTFPPAEYEVQHYPVMNSSKGYCVVGQNTKDEYAPTILDCVQLFIVDKLFAKAYGKQLAISRDSVVQWEAIFNKAIVELPAEHYKDLTELENASNSIDFVYDESCEKPVQDAPIFESLFSSEALRKNRQKLQALSRVAPSATSPGSVDSTIITTAYESSDAKSESVDSVRNHATAYETSHSFAVQGSSQSISETVVTARYMIKHGLEKLIESNEIDQQQAVDVMRILCL